MSIMDGIFDPALRRFVEVCFEVMTLPDGSHPIGFRDQADQIVLMPWETYEVVVTFHVLTSVSARVTLSPRGQTRGAKDLTGLVDTQLLKSKLIM